MRGPALFSEHVRTDTCDFGFIRIGRSGKRRGTRTRTRAFHYCQLREHACSRTHARTRARVGEKGALQRDRYRVVPPSPVALAAMTPHAVVPAMIALFASLLLLHVPTAGADESPSTDLAPQTARPFGPRVGAWVGRRNLALAGEPASAFPFQLNSPTACRKLWMSPWNQGLIHSLTSELNFRTFGNTSLTLELNLSTFGTHPRINLGYMGDKVSLSEAERGNVSS